MPSRSRAAALLLVATIAFAAVNVWTTVSRSLISREIAGVVQDIEVRTEKHPGVDDVWLVHVADEQVHVDAATAARLQVGDTIGKSAWDRTLMVNGASVRLAVSGDARAMFWVMPLTVLAAAIAAAVSVRIGD